MRLHDPLGVRPNRGFPGTSANSPKLRVVKTQKNSRRLWRSRRRRSSSIPAGAANFPAAVFLAGKCPKLGRDSISQLPENQGIIFQQRRNLPENLSSREFRTATAFSSYLKNSVFGKWLRIVFSGVAPATKPKKGLFMNFSQGHSVTKVQSESCFFS